MTLAIVGGSTRKINKSFHQREGEIFIKVKIVLKLEKRGKTYQLHHVGFH